MNYIINIQTLKLLTSIGIISLFNSCSNISLSPPIPSMLYSASSQSTLNNNSVSSSTRKIVKTGSMKLKTKEVRKTAEKIEHITLTYGGHMTEYIERNDHQKNASFSIRIPANKLVITMDEIAELGKVTYRRTEVSDTTNDLIRQKANLAKLKQRRARLKAIFYKTTKTNDKLTLEQKISEIEEQIFNIEESYKQLNKFSNYSKLNISISQSKIRGPLGITIDSSKWLISRLFTIRE